jgi:hypothetical protein
MAENTGNVIKVPSNSSVAEVKPGEIIASYARFTQKGVTLKGGQGTLVAGTVLGKETATKKYLAYNDGNSPAGIGVARGVLRQTVDTTDGDVLGNLVVSGILKNDQIIGEDANAIADLNARVDSENNLFIF